MHAKKPLGEKKEQSCASIGGEREHLYHTGLLWAHRNPKEAHFKTNVLRLPYVTIPYGLGCPWSGLTAGGNVGRAHGLPSGRCCTKQCTFLPPLLPQAV